MESLRYLTQFLYLLVYSGSLINASSIIIFKKKLVAAPDKHIKRLIFLIALCSTIISLQVFLNAVGLTERLNHADSAKLVLIMNMLIITGIAALVYSATMTSFTLRPAQFSKKIRVSAGAGAVLLLTATLVIQVMILFSHSLIAEALLSIFIISAIAIFSVAVIFSAIRLFIPFRLGTGQYGLAELRILLLMLFIFPVVFLISSSTIGAVSAPVGFIILNIACMRVIYIRVEKPRHPDAAKMPGNSLTVCCSELGLSKRESEVAVLLARGRSYKEISNELFISMSTTQTHVGRIYSKLGINNKTELSNILNYQQSGK